MLKKIKLPKNKLACFHYHTLTKEEQEFIIFNTNPVEFLNAQIESFNIYTDEMLNRFPHAKKDLETLKSIIEKLDIFDKGISLKSRKGD